MHRNPGSSKPLLQDNGRPSVAASEDAHTDFLHIIAHKLHTHLCDLQDYAEMLHTEEVSALTTQQKQAAEMIASRVRELETLAERIDVLVAARACATVSVPLSLAEIIAEVVAGRQTAASQAGLTLKALLEPSLPLVTGDPHQLRSALDCLLENALQHTPGGGRVEVQAYTEPGWACLAVSDTGVGMTEEEMEYVHSLFCQTDGTKMPHQRSHGLGLDLVSAVVDGHDGQVGVASQPGHGSRFTLKLPVMPSGAESGAARRILVVDDEENVALTLQDGLEKLPNCEVAVATSSEEALQCLEGAPFDLLVTDYKMPGMDGLALASRVRRLYPQVSVVMITAYSSHSLRRQAAKVPIERVLDKPVQLDEIRSVVWETLESSSTFADNEQVFE